MYYIRKYSDCWAIHDDDDAGTSRPLTKEETGQVCKEFLGLLDDKVRTVYTDTLNSVRMVVP